MSEDSPADTNQLFVLTILWYAWGALTMIGSCAGGVFALLGGAAGAMDPSDAQLQQASAGMAWLFGVAAVTIFAWGVLNVWSGWSLSQCRNRLLISVMSAVNLLSFPLGTILGVFTLVVLGRPAVRARFARRFVT